jgi:hypothetical protein
MLIKVLYADAFPPAQPYNPTQLMEKTLYRIREKGEFTFAVTGGFKDGGQSCQGLLQYVDKEIKPDFVITLGDLVWYGPDIKNGVHKFDPLEEYSGWFFRKYPVWPANGDQEGTKNFLTFFGLSSENYSMQVLNTRFIFVGYDPHPPRGRWLIREFNEAKEKGQYVFICGQRIYFSPYYKHYIKNGTPVEWEDFYAKYKTTAVFGADNYLYYRTKRQGVTYFVAAGGGPGPDPLTWPERIQTDDAYASGISKEEQPYKGGEWLIHSPAFGEDFVLKQYEHYAVVITVKGKHIYGKTLTETGQIIDKFVLVGD